jgi:hypothetical protein
MKLTDVPIAILRAAAGAPITPDQLADRLGYRPSKPLLALEAAGYITMERSGKAVMAYAITDAGRAACPPRNPASAARTVPASNAGAGLPQRQGGRYIVSV